MKEKYLEELRKELETNDFINADEIVEKYRRRYEFGIESDMSEEEIEKRLGDPKDIVNKMNGKTCDIHIDEKKEKETKKLKIEINTVVDDVEFEESKDNNIHLYMDDIEDKSYKIINKDDEIYINPLTKKFFGLNRRRPGKFTVALPDNIAIDYIKLGTTSGDFESKIDLKCNEFKFSSVSGDSEFNVIKTKRFKLHVVSGDIEIKEINSDYTEISSVSGDIDVEYLLSNTLTVDNISGDIKIKESSNDIQIKSNSVAGNVYINGKKFKNVTTKVKEVFKSES